MSKKKELTAWEKGVLLEEIKHLDTTDKIENFIKRNWELLYDSMEEENEKLKQQLVCYEDEIKNRGTCGLCEKLENKQINELKQRLAEKEKETETYKKEIVFLDKKINNLKEEIEDIKNLYSKKLINKIEVKCFGATENFKKQLRHEICEKIRKYLKYNNGQEWILMLDETISLNEVLDKIEKGEE